MGPTRCGRSTFRGRRFMRTAWRFNTRLIIATCASRRRCRQTSARCSCVSGNAIAKPVDAVRGDHASSMPMYEARHAPLATRTQFIHRIARAAGVALVVIGGSLAWGMWGYWYYEHLSWLDAFLNAAMLLGGMGPVENPQTRGGKLFAGIYALYAGMVVLVAASILIAPAF